MAVIWPLKSVKKSIYFLFFHVLYNILHGLFLTPMFMLKIPSWSVSVLCKQIVCYDMSWQKTIIHFHIFKHCVCILELFSNETV
jgi:hypothetical protein